MVAKTRTKYLSDEDTIHAITMATANLAAAGAPPGGGVSSGIKAKISKGKREYGLAPRGLRLARTIGTAPDTFVRYAFLPILTPGVYAPILLHSTVTYSGQSWEVIKKIPEND